MQWSVATCPTAETQHVEYRLILSPLLPYCSMQSNTRNQQNCWLEGLKSYPAPEILTHPPTSASTSLERELPPAPGATAARSPRRQCTPASTRWNTRPTYRRRTPPRCDRSSTNGRCRHDGSAESRGHEHRWCPDIGISGTYCGDPGLGTSQRLRGIQPGADSGSASPWLGDMVRSRHGHGTD